MLAWLATIGWTIFDVLYYFGLRRPRLLRIVMDFFRRVSPIYPGPLARFGLTAFLVTRADDVQEVLRRSNDFLLGPVNRRKILSGDFVISLDPERKYLREKAIIRDSLPQDRLLRLEKIVNDAAARELAVRPNPFEVAEFAERITVVIVEEFWGLKADGAQSEVVHAPEGAETLRLWLRKLAIVLGSREAGPFGIREVGLQCSEEFMSFVRAACEIHPRNADDMIAHILMHSGDLDVAARNIAGLVMTGSAVVTKAFCHALDQLLRRKEPRDAAFEAARRDDREGMGRLLIEALRFNPVFPVLPRYCVRNTTLAADTPRETEIPAGVSIYASPTGAMFDPSFVDQPDRFSLGRNLQLNEKFADGWRYGSRFDHTPGVYALFGGGEHWCLGEQMALAEMAVMGIALLNALPGAEISRGLRYDGSAVASLRLRHGA